VLGAQYPKFKGEQDLCICIGRCGFLNVAVPLTPPSPKERESPPSLGAMDGRPFRSSGSQSPFGEWEHR